MAASARAPARLRGAAGLRPPRRRASPGSGSSAGGAEPRPSSEGQAHARRPDPAGAAVGLVKRIVAVYGSILRLVGEVARLERQLRLVGEVVGEGGVDVELVLVEAEIADHRRVERPAIVGGDPD